MCRLLGRVFIRIYESISFSLDVCNVTVASEIDDSEKVNLEQPGTIEEMNQSHDVHTQSPRNIVPKLPERVISKKRGNIPLNSFNSKYPETQNIPIFLVYGYLKQTIASKAKIASKHESDEPDFKRKMCRTLNIRKSYVHRRARRIASLRNSPKASLKRKSVDGKKNEPIPEKKSC